jgi:Fe-S cluster assembly protein SufD
LRLDLINNGSEHNKKDPMADVTLIKTEAEQQLEAQWQGAKARLPGPAALRTAAFQQFAATGLPHRRVEEWKYTDLRTLMRDAKPLAAPPDAAARERARDAGKLLGDVECRRLVFVDGAFVPEISQLDRLEAGLTIQSLATALGRGDALVNARLGQVLPTVNDVAVALNTAFMGDGAVIHVAPGATLERPLHLVFVASGTKPASIFTRSLMLVERGARAMIVESHEGVGDDYQINTALELDVGDEAHVDHIKITSERANALHVSSLLASVGARARFNTFAFTLGSAVVRNQLFIRFAGDGTVAGIRGASLLRGRQHVDTTLVAEHVAVGCQSRETFKSVLDEESRAVFQGKIIVAPRAQKTDAKMATHALLLSDTAEADNKPELEIFADDVQCGHGATAGALDDTLLFYLKARGIPAKEAQALLIQAFVGEAVEGIEHAGLREALMENVVAWLGARE